MHLRYKTVWLLLISCISISFSITFTDVRENFEWGEYAKLVDAVEPMVDSLSSIKDTTLAASYFLYLGIAYYGTGKPGSAREMFLRALQKSPSITLEKSYVSEEITDLFEKTQADFINRNTLKMNQDSLLAERQKLVTENPLNKEIVQPQNKRSVLKTFVVSTFCSSVISGIFAAYEYYSSKQTYANFRQSASTGNKVSYDQDSKILKKANILIAGSGILSGIFGTSGIYLTIKLNRSARLQHLK